jgi:hypothetical protein
VAWLELLLAVMFGDPDGPAGGHRDGKKIVLS